MADRKLGVSLYSCVFFILTCVCILLHLHRCGCLEINRPFLTACRRPQGRFGAGADRGSRFPFGMPHDNKANAPLELSLVRGGMSTLPVHSLPVQPLPLILWRLKPQSSLLPPIFFCLSAACMKGSGLIPLCLW